MIVDTSALISVLRHEPDGDLFAEALANASTGISVSAATMLEAHIVVQRLDTEGLEERLDELIADYSIEILPFGASQLSAAIEAHRRFGKGSGHQARLNFGDCFAYALAKESGEPLLFKGDDFARTDVEAVLT